MDNFIDKFAQRRNAQEIIRANAMAEAKERERLQSELSEYELAMQEMRRCNLQNLENAEKVKELLEVSLDKIYAVQKRDARYEGSSDQTVGEVRILLENLRRQMEELAQKQYRQVAELSERQRGQAAELSEKQSRIKETLEKQQKDAAELSERQSRMEELAGKRQEDTARLLEKQGRMEELLERQQMQAAEFLEGQKSRETEQADSRKADLEEMIKATEDFNHKEAVKVYRNVQAVIEGALPKQTVEITESVKNMTGKGKAPAGLMVVGVLTLLAAVANVAIEVLQLLGYL